MPDLAERAGAELVAHDDSRALHLELLELHGRLPLARTQRRQLAAQAVGRLCTHAHTRTRALLDHNPSRDVRTHASSRAETYFRSAR